MSKYIKTFLFHHVCVIILVKRGINGKFITSLARQIIIHVVLFLSKKIKLNHCSTKPVSEGFINILITTSLSEIWNIICTKKSSFKLVFYALYSNTRIRCMLEWFPQCTLYIIQVQTLCSIRTLGLYISAMRVQQLCARDSYLLNRRQLQCIPIHFGLPKSWK